MLNTLREPVTAKIAYATLICHVEQINTFWLVPFFSNYVEAKERMEIRRLGVKGFG